MFLADGNGIVALTDSRLTMNGRPMSDPAQKLFPLDIRTIVTFAGFASQPLPMDPEILNSTSDVIQGYATELILGSSGEKLSLKRKLEGLAFVLGNQLEHVMMIDRDRPHERDFDVELTIAGYDIDKSPKIEWVDLSLTNPNPFYSVSVGEVQEKLVGRDFTHCIRGIPFTAEDILNNPKQYRAEPIVARYSESLQAGAAPLTLDEMENLAKFLKERTAVDYAEVGGPDQIAVLGDGFLKALKQPQFPKKPPLPRMLFSFVEQNTFDQVPDEAEPIAATPPMTLLFANNTFQHRHIVLDGGYFFNNLFDHCIVAYNGGRTKFVDGQNDVASSDLILGPSVDLQSAEVKKLRRLPWRSVKPSSRSGTGSSKSHLSADNTGRPIFLCSGKGRVSRTNQNSRCCPVQARLGAGVSNGDNKLDSTTWGFTSSPLLAKAARSGAPTVVVLPARTKDGPVRASVLRHCARFGFHFGITSCASLLDITSRISLRFFPASSMASRDP